MATIFIISFILLLITLLLNIHPNFNWRKMTYSKFHKLMLQQLIKKKYVTESEYKKLISNIKEIFPEIEPDSEEIDDINKVINEEITPFHIKVQYLIHPKTKERFYGIINEIGSKEDEISKMSTTFNVHELQYFKNLVTFHSLKIRYKKL